MKLLIIQEAAHKKYVEETLPPMLEKLENLVKGTEGHLVGDYVSFN